MNWSSEAVRLKTGGGLSDVHEDLSYFQVFVSFSPFAGPFFFPPSQLPGDGAPEVMARPKFCGWRLAQNPGKEWTLTCTAPAKMVARSPGHRGSAVSSSHKHFCSRSRRFHRLLLFLCPSLRRGQAGGRPSK